MKKPTSSRIGSKSRSSGIFAEDSLFDAQFPRYVRERSTHCGLGCSAVRDDDRVQLGSRASAVSYRSRVATYFAPWRHSLVRALLDLASTKRMTYENHRRRSAHRAERTHA